MWMFLLGIDQNLCFICLNKFGFLTFCQFLRPPSLSIIKRENLNQRKAQRFQTSKRKKANPPTFKKAHIRKPKRKAETISNPQNSLPKQKSNQTRIPLIIKPRMKQQSSIQVTDEEELIRQQQNRAAQRESVKWQGVRADGSTVIDGKGYQRVPWKARHPEDMLPSDLKSSQTNPNNQAIMSPMSSQINSQSPAFNTIQHQNVNNTFDSSQGFSNQKNQYRHEIQSNNFRANESIYSSGARSSNNNKTAFEQFGNGPQKQRHIRSKFKEVDYSNITRSMLERQKNVDQHQNLPPSRGLISSSNQSKRFGSIDTNFKQQIDQLKRKRAMDHQARQVANQTEIVQQNQQDMVSDDFFSREIEQKFVPPQIMQKAQTQAPNSLRRQTTRQETHVDTTQGSLENRSGTQNLNDNDQDRDYNLEREKDTTTYYQANKAKKFATIQHSHARQTEENNEDYRQFGGETTANDRQPNHHHQHFQQMINTNNTTTSAFSSTMEPPEFNNQGGAESERRNIHQTKIKSFGGHINNQPPHHNGPIQSGSQGGSRIVQQAPTFRQMLPQIGTANPQIYGRKKHLADTLNNTSLEGGSSANRQQKEIGDFQYKALAKYNQSNVTTQSMATSGYNNTGFNWRQVDMKTNSGAAFEENSIVTERDEQINRLKPRTLLTQPGRGRPLNKPAREKRFTSEVNKRLDYARTNVKDPNEILSDMKSGKNMGKVDTKVVSEAVFERLAKQGASKGDGQPMVEKTIFIVKPIYVNVDQLSNQKRRQEVRQKSKKKIYQERMRPISYEVSDKPRGVQLKKAMGRKQRRSPDPLQPKPLVPHNGQIYVPKLDLGVAHQVQAQQEQQEEQYRLQNDSMVIQPELTATYRSKEMISTSRNGGGGGETSRNNNPLTLESTRLSVDHPKANIVPKPKKPKVVPFDDKRIEDLKKVLESSKLIDEIFHQRTLKLEREKQKLNQKDAKLEVKEEKKREKMYKEWGGREEYDKVHGMHKSMQIDVIQKKKSARKSLVKAARDQSNGLEENSKDKIAVMDEQDDDTTTPDKVSPRQQEFQQPPPQHQKVNPFSQKPLNNQSVISSTAYDRSRMALFNSVTSFDSKDPRPVIEQFTGRCNETLKDAHAGIQIVMQESKDAYFFKQKQRDMEKYGAYDKVKNWQLNPVAFEATIAPDMSLPDPTAPPLSKKQQKSAQKNQDLPLRFLNEPSIERNSPFGKEESPINGQTFGRLGNQSTQKGDHTKSVTINYNSISPRGMPVKSHAKNSMNKNYSQGSLGGKSKNRSQDRRSNSNNYNDDGTRSIGKTSRGQQRSLYNQTTQSKYQAYSKSQLEQNQLTHERIHALRSMTKDLTTPVQIPIELDTTWCSHVPPQFSAQMAHGSDLIDSMRQSIKKNPYKYWEDRNVHGQEHPIPSSTTAKKQHNHHHSAMKCKTIPKHFYSNFKSNAVNNAIPDKLNISSQKSGLLLNSARRSDGNRSNTSNPNLIPQLQNPNPTNCSNCHELIPTDYNCPCNSGVDKKKSAKQLKFYKYKGWRSPRQKQISKQRIIQTSYQLFKPYRPCRRGCSSVHNPAMHATRMQAEHMQRMHQSATKLMIMSVIPERPYSADSEARRRAAYLKEIDLHKSLLNRQAIQRQDTLKQRRQQRAAAAAGENSTSKNSQNPNNSPSKLNNSMDSQGAKALFGDLLGIPAAGGGNSASPNKLSNNNAVAGQGLLGSSGLSHLDLTLHGQPSSLNLIEDNISQSEAGDAGHHYDAKQIEFENRNSFNFVEVEYLISLMKNRSVAQKRIKENQFEQIYKKARKTLKVAMKRLLLVKQFRHIDAQYKLAANEKQTAANLIKILSRCKKMYDAQQEIVRILTLLHYREDKVQQFKEHMRQSAAKIDINYLKRMYATIVQASSRVFTTITVLKSMEKTLNRPFVFNNNAYDSNFMQVQLRRYRLRLLYRYPNELNQTEELNRILLKSGEVGFASDFKPRELKDGISETSIVESTDDENFDIQAEVNKKFNDSTASLPKGVRGELGVQGNGGSQKSLMSHAKVNVGEL